MTRRLWALETRPGGALLRYEYAMPRLFPTRVVAMLKARDAHPRARPVAVRIVRVGDEWTGRRVQSRTLFRGTAIGEPFVDGDAKAVVVKWDGCCPTINWLADIVRLSSKPKPRVRRKGKR